MQLKFTETLNTVEKNILSLVELMLAPKDKDKEIIAALNAACAINFKKLSQQESDPLKLKKLEFYEALVNFCLGARLAYDIVNHPDGHSKQPDYLKIKQEMGGTLKAAITKLNELKSSFPKEWGALLASPEIYQTMFLLFFQNIKHQDAWGLMALCRPWVKDLSSGLFAERAHKSSEKALTLEESLEYLLLLMECQQNQGEMVYDPKKPLQSQWNPLFKIRHIFSELFYKDKDYYNLVSPLLEKSLVFPEALPKEMAAWIRDDFAGLMLKALCRLQNLPMLVAYTNQFARDNYLPKDICTQQTHEYYDQMVPFHLNFKEIIAGSSQEETARLEQLKRNDERELQLEVLQLFNALGNHLASFKKQLLFVDHHLFINQQVFFIAREMDKLFKPEVWPELNKNQVALYSKNILALYEHYPTLEDEHEHRQFFLNTLQRLPFEEEQKKGALSESQSGHFGAYKVLAKKFLALLDTGNWQELSDAEQRQFFLCGGQLLAAKLAPLDYGTYHETQTVLIQLCQHGRTDVAFDLLKARMDANRRCGANPHSQDDSVLFIILSFLRLMSDALATHPTLLQKQTEVFLQALDGFNLFENQYQVLLDSFSKLSQDFIDRHEHSRSFKGLKEHLKGELLKKLPFIAFQLQALSFKKEHGPSAAEEVPKAEILKDFILKIAETLGLSQAEFEALLQAQMSTPLEIPDEAQAPASPPAFKDIASLSMAKVPVNLLLKALDNSTASLDTAKQFSNDPWLSIACHRFINQKNQQHAWKALQKNENLALLYANLFDVLFAPHKALPANKQPLPLEDGERARWMYHQVASQKGFSVRSRSFLAFARKVIKRSQAEQLEAKDPNENFLPSLASSALLKAVDGFCFYLENIEKDPALKEFLVKDKICGRPSLYYSLYLDMANEQVFSLNEAEKPTIWLDALDETASTPLEKQFLAHCRSLIRPLKGQKEEKAGDKADGPYLGAYKAMETVVQNPDQSVSLKAFKNLRKQKLIYPPEVPGFMGQLHRLMLACRFVRVQLPGFPWNLQAAAETIQNMAEANYFPDCPTKEERRQLLSYLRYWQKLLSSVPNLEGIALENSPQEPSKLFSAKKERTYLHYVSIMLGSQLNFEAQSLDNKRFLVECILHYLKAPDNWAMPDKAKFLQAMTKIALASTQDAQLSSVLEQEGLRIHPLIGPLLQADLAEEAGQFLKTLSEKAPPANKKAYGDLLSVVRQALENGSMEIGKQRRSALADEKNRGLFAAAFMQLEDGFLSKEFALTKASLLHLLKGPVNPQWQEFFASLSTPITEQELKDEEALVIHPAPSSEAPSKSQRKAPAVPKQPKTQQPPLPMLAEEEEGPEEEELNLASILRPRAPTKKPLMILKRREAEEKPVLNAPKQPLKEQPSQARAPEEKKPKANPIRRPHFSYRSQAQRALYGTKLVLQRPNQDQCLPGAGGSTLLNYGKGLRPELSSAASPSLSREAKVQPAGAIDKSTDGRFFSPAKEAVLAPSARPPLEEKKGAEEKPLAAALPALARSQTTIPKPVLPRSLLQLLEDLKAFNPNVRPALFSTAAAHALRRTNLTHCGRFELMLFVCETDKNHAIQKLKDFFSNLNYASYFVSVDPRDDTIRLRLLRGFGFLYLTVRMVEYKNEQNLEALLQKEVYSSNHNLEGIFARLWPLEKPAFEVFGTAPGIESLFASVFDIVNQEQEALYENHFTALIDLAHYELHNRDMLGKSAVLTKALQKDLRPNFLRFYSELHNRAHLSHARNFLFSHSDFIESVAKLSELKAIYFMTGIDPEPIQQTLPSLLPYRNCKDLYRLNQIFFLYLYMQYRFHSHDPAQGQLFFKHWEHFLREEDLEYVRFIDSQFEDETPHTGASLDPDFVNVWNAVCLYHSSLVKASQVSGNSFHFLNTGAAPNVAGESATVAAESADALPGSTYNS